MGLGDLDKQPIFRILHDRLIFLLNSQVRYIVLAISRKRIASSQKPFRLFLFGPIEVDLGG